MLESTSEGNNASFGALGRGGQCVPIPCRHWQLSVPRAQHRCALTLGVPTVCAQPFSHHMATHGLPPVPQEHVPVPGNRARALGRVTERHPAFPRHGRPSGGQGARGPRGRPHPPACTGMRMGHGPRARDSSSPCSPSSTGFFPLYDSFAMRSSQAPSQPATPFVPSGKQHI